MIDTTTYLNSTMSRRPQGPPSKEMGKDVFLKLFIAQLRHQDPLNPMKDKETVAQLAQFSSLEQMTGIGKKLDNMAKLMIGQQAVNASSYIGKNVHAAGNCVTLKTGKATKVSFTLKGDAKAVTAHIYDKNKNIVRSITIGAKKKGTHDLDWDGRDSKGRQLGDGQYTVRFASADKNGKPVMTSSEVAGKVKSIFVENGVVMLGLEDGRKVALSGVARIGADEQQQAA